MNSTTDASQSIENLLTQWEPFIPRLSSLIRFYFILISTTALLTATLPPLRNSILTYGKLDPVDQGTVNSSSDHTSTPQQLASVQQGGPKPKPIDPAPRLEKESSLLDWVHSIRVPKKWFAHFYVVATLWMFYLSLDLFYFLWLNSSNNSSDNYTNGDSGNTFLTAVDTTLGSTHPLWSILTLLRQLRIMPSAHITKPDPLMPSRSFQDKKGSVLLSGMLLLPTEILVAMTCYQIHVIRRWYESWFLERPSAKATIHLGHYLVGISFYGAFAPALWIDYVESLLSPLSESSGIGHRVVGEEARVFRNWLLGFGVGLFLWASWHQYQCHRILANLRTPTTTVDNKKDCSSQEEKSASSDYKVPFGDWFEYMVTPHYSAEMVIYFALFLMTTAGSISSTLFQSSTSLLETIGSLSCWTRPDLRWIPTMLFAWVWVVVNLGIVARETDQWYRARFGDQYFDPSVSVSANSTTESEHIKDETEKIRPSRTRQSRKILIPFVY